MLKSQIINFCKFISLVILVFCSFLQTNAQAKKSKTTLKKKVIVVDSLPIKAKIKASSDSLKLLKPLEWQTNVFKANDLAVAQNKTVFAFFTGSDWCGWCIRLQENVFKKKEFIQWANKNVVLLELDYPRGKQLPPDLAQQNNELKQVFQVQGYPTIWMFNLMKDTATNKININAYGNLGYPPGAEPGKEEVSFLKTANEILDKKNKIATK